MTIRRRKLTGVPRSYREYRAVWWDRALAYTRPVTNFNWRASKWENGEALAPDEVVLVPKWGYQNKDVWHCGSRAAARMLAREVLGFEDVNGLEFKNRLYVYVEYDDKNLPHMLPQQYSDDRERHLGRTNR